MKKVALWVGTHLPSLIQYNSISTINLIISKHLSQIASELQASSFWLKVILIHVSYKKKGKKENFDLKQEDQLSYKRSTEYWQGTAILFEILGNYVFLHIWDFFSKNLGKNGKNTQNWENKDHFRIENDSLIRW